jgi:hypothetical protein
MAEGVALGKGAWDCDANKLIPPEKEASYLSLCPILWEMADIET